MADGQPIDSAPKDGSEFLAYDPVAKKFDVCTYEKRWNRFYQTQMDGESGPGEDDFQAERATLWWPLS